MTQRTLHAALDTICGFGLRALSPDMLDTLHYATLEVLAETGLKVESAEAVEILNGAGARVQQKNDHIIVKIPAYLVEKSISLAPSAVVLHGRDPAQDMVLAPGRVGFTLFGENVKINDLATLENRSCTKKDLASATRVADALDEIVVIEKCMGSLDKPPLTQALHNFEALMSNTGKHVLLGFYSAANAERIIEMGAAGMGGMEAFKTRPCVSSLICPTSPLTLVQMCCEVISAVARLGVALVAVPAPLCGATAANTLASTLVIQNAEVLGALVLAQLTSPGTPFIYGACGTIMDLRGGTAAFGAPEFGMLSAGATKLAQYYRLPNWNGSGVSDSKMPDAQAASEFALNTTLTALSGTNLIFSCGSLESGLTFDYAKLIMDAEHIRRLQRVLGGIVVTDETLALDVIREIGPGGTFIDHEHTYDNRHNMSQSMLFDRRTRDQWMAATGGRDLTERAYDKARDILANHVPFPLPEGAAETMAAIITEAENQ